MREKSKCEAEVEERTGSSCAALTGGTRSAFGCVGLSASARVASAKAEGRKTPKSALLTSYFLLLTSLTGCVYKGAKVTEGTDLAIGINAPISEGTLQLQVLNYLSGFRLGVDRNAILKCHYTVSETNDYLGVVHTRVSKTVDATVEPCGETKNEE